MDVFYKPIDFTEVPDVTNYNFDDPDAIDVDLLANTLKLLKSGQQAEIPAYDHNKG